VRLSKIECDRKGWHVLQQVLSKTLNEHVTFVPGAQLLYSGCNCFYCEYDGHN